MVTLLRSAWDNQDPCDGDRGGKCHGKTGRHVHVADADRAWSAEQISYSILAEGAQAGVSWSYDPDEAMWCCGVLHPTISEPEVVDWEDDWSPQESRPFVEDVTFGQSQTLALGSPDDVMPARCVHQADSLAVEAPRTLAQARTAVAAVKKNSQRFSFLHPTLLPVARARRSSRWGSHFSWDLQWSFGFELSTLWSFRLMEFWIAVRRMLVESMQSRLLLML